MVIHRSHHTWCPGADSRKSYLVDYLCSLHLSCKEFPGDASGYLGCYMLLWKLLKAMALLCHGCRRVHVGHQCHIEPCTRMTDAWAVGLLEEQTQVCWAGGQVHRWAGTQVCWAGGQAHRWEGTQVWWAGTGFLRPHIS